MERRRRLFPTAPGCLSKATRMGEGFLRQPPPHPIITRGSTELPSPAAEVGFIRLRPSLRVPELGLARVPVAEVAIMPTEFAVASHDVKQPTSRSRDAFRIPLAHPRYVVNRRSQDVVTRSAESWANVGRGKRFALSKMRTSVISVTFRRPALSLFFHHGGRAVIDGGYYGPSCQ